jgi:hypothetical protein
VRRLLVNIPDIVEQIMADAKSTGNPDLLRILSEGLSEFLPDFKIVRPKRATFRVITGGLKAPASVQNIQKKKSAP